MSKLSPSKFCHCTQSSADAPIVALLWKLPANAIMQHKQRLLGQIQFDMFYKNYCCAAIHCQKWNELCTKLKLTNYAIMRWNSFVISVFNFEENFESNPGFLLRNSFELILKTWKKVMLTCLTKIIADQSSVRQYAWSMCHMKEE